MSKKFRLFISSTFNDFRREREVLQSKVFPVVSEYAFEKGYQFQEIDLRWGVSDEAQLDQKTLELCLDEVRTCKSYTHPNFLIMVGDRYGWIPLPYVIEKDELETLLCLMPTEAIYQVLEWYKLDKNHIPLSFILKEREGEFIASQKWSSVETSLRKILQESVFKSKLPMEKIKKYFFSATDAEVEEGILSYIDKTTFQEELLKKKATQYEVDSQYVFGFFRTVEKKCQIGNKFIGDDYREAQEFKRRVASSLPKENRVEVETRQVNVESLDEKYLLDFIKEVTRFLKQQIDAQIEEDSFKTDELALEISQQKSFALEKRVNFLGLENELLKVTNYIVDEERSPLIVTAPSGAGKSAFLAKAIELIEVCSDKKIIYRFVGATSHSSNSRDILESIFAELGENLGLLADEESFEKFSMSILNKMMQIEENVVILIDGVDKLDNEDKFFWLPKELPSNVKVIITALEDAKYISESQYAKYLTPKSDNFIVLPPFENPLVLLELLLSAENRCIQSQQAQQFLEEFKSSPTPFYVKMAVAQIKYASSGKVLVLKAGHKSSVDDFFHTLWQKKHHNREFVERVLLFLFLSRDGLSESELLELLSVDKEFIKRMAPELYHENITKKLPFIHWSRLHAVLDPFLSIKLQDGEELLSFFHREFFDVIGEIEIQQNFHELMLLSVQILIGSNKKFHANRWGKVYAELVILYTFNYSSQEKRYREFITENRDLPTGWKEEYLLHLEKLAKRAVEQNDIKKAIDIYEIIFDIYVSCESCMEDVDEEYWGKKYLSSANILATYYLVEGNKPDATSLREHSLEASTEMYKQNASAWREEYVTALHNMAQINEERELELSVKQHIEVLKICSKEKTAFYSSVYCSSAAALATLYISMNKLDMAFSIEKRVLLKSEALFVEDPLKWVTVYVIAVNNLAQSYRVQEKVEDAILLQTSLLEKVKILYSQNMAIWRDYTLALSQLATSYSRIENYDKAIELEEQSKEIQLEYFMENSSLWAETFYLTAMHLVELYKNVSQKDTALEYSRQVLTISQKYYKENEEHWREQYVTAMSTMVYLLVDMENEKEAFHYAKMSYQLCKKYYGESDQRSVMFSELIELYNEEILDKSIREEGKVACLGDILHLSKFIMIVDERKVMRVYDILEAFFFIVLNNTGKTLFSQLFVKFDIDIMEKFPEAQESIAIAKEYTEEFGYDEDILDFITTIEENAKLDIGILRE